ncbi:DUF397 domain-containing protein [Yinghuangia sp. ASG 101]|uniref:DUF397 domain-containing protein n=1 Tax=Yinghuangia sp. ASG 101 TaxID=2896848 RepID=UPI001E3C5749|nr:DUF397 domain-containing protein [Yinghuangia sp. ASG 101]UGQ15166.1 DUF397 domain-containing protein [Yinghuangia sp. ASG 101]
MAEIITANTPWRRSSHSQTGNCVEARADARILVRDSRRPHGPRVGVATEAWRMFTEGLRGA